MNRSQIKKMYKKNIYLLIIVIFIIGGFIFVNNSNAQETLNLLSDLSSESSLPQMPGRMEGEGVYFEITNSEYLNLKLDSSESIKLTLESIPEMVTMNIETPTSTIATSTQIALSGFNPNTTYYKYQDDYHNLTEFITDENGSYSYIQDLSQLHFIFIQPRKSTKFIRDDATGGDCALIGNWNQSTKTCTLTKDLNETIQINNNYIILDGGGYSVIGNNTGYGIYIPYGIGGITIKNLTIKKFSKGIYLYYSGYNTIENNIISLNYGFGIHFYASYNNIFTNNTVNSNNYGMEVFSSRNNTFINNKVNSNNAGIIIQHSSNNVLKDNIINSNYYSGISIRDFSKNNTFMNNIINLNGTGIDLREYSDNNILTSNIIDSNRYSGIIIGYSYNNTLIDNLMNNNKYNFYLYGGSDSHFNNNIDTSNTVDGKPIYYIKNASNQTYDNLTNIGIFYCINCDNIIIKNLTFIKNGAGIFLWKTKNSRIENISASNNYLGEIVLYYSNNNILDKNIVSNGDSGILIYSSSDNKIINNTIDSNSNYGLLLSNYSRNNKIYNNNFINNTRQAYVYTGSDNIFNLNLPIGGNYWSDYDTPEEGCNDLNSDNICDSPYIFSGGQDNLPWKLKDGWLLPQQPPQMVNPTDNGTLKCGFGCKLNHEGIDIDKSLYQKPVKAPASGTVVKIDNVDDSNAGKWVWIYHGDITKLDGSIVNKISTRYLHLDTIDSSISIGQQINQGTTIGTVGDTGGSINYVPHLHFEVRQGDIPVDLDFRKTTALDPLGFVSYPSSVFSVIALSPVDIAITDPEEMVIDKIRNDFGFAADYFAPQYKGIPDDGEDIDGYDMVTFDQKKDGDYLVRVIPEQGALIEDTFTLKANICGASTTLSENTLVSNIPDSPYILRLTECSFERFIPTKIIIPALNTEYVLGSQIQIQFSAIDNIFGTANISAKLNGEEVFNGQNVILTKPGDNTLEITATDNNGYATTLIKTFSVIYNFSNFLPPIKIDGSGVYNLGRTLPVKFQLINVNGNFVSTASGQLYVAKISDGIVGNDEVPLSVSSADSGNQFRYDFINNQYIYNLSTDTLTAGSWQLKAVLNSGQIFTAIISIK